MKPLLPSMRLSAPQRPMKFTPSIGKEWRLLDASEMPWRHQPKCLTSAKVCSNACRCSGGTQDLQSRNRYACVLKSPLRYTDQTPARTSSRRPRRCAPWPRPSSPSVTCKVEGLQIGWLRDAREGRLPADGGATSCFRWCPRSHSTVIAGEQSCRSVPEGGSALGMQRDDRRVLAEYASGRTLTQSSADTRTG